MTYTLTSANGTTRIDVDFADEGVALAGHTTVKGDEQVALAYLPVFEADLRRNFAERFPAIVAEGLRDDGEGDGGEPE